ncbi:MAG: two-component regulator propeller domain-containing protein, partial [Bacteroidota bacterium]
MIVAASTGIVQAQTPESRAPVVPTTPRFEMYTTGDGLPGNIMRGVVQDSLGYIWVGGVGGVARFDGTGFETIPLAEVPSYTADVSNVSRLYADPQGTVWVATFGEGLQRYDQRRQRFEAYLPDSTDTTKLFGSHVYALLTDRRGRTWVSSRYDLDAPENSRVQWLDAETGTFSPFEGRTHADTLSDEASDFLEDRDGMIWIADYYDGLQRYDPETGTVTRFRHDPADPTTLHGDRLMTLYEDRDGYIWAGGGDYFGQTAGGGLSRF